MISFSIRRLASTLALALLLTSVALADQSSSKHTVKSAKPKITMKQARIAALKAVPDGRIKSAELETEAGKRIYSFDVKTKDGIKEVWVDPQTGEVIKNEAETRAQEKAEKAIDKHKK